MLDVPYLAQTPELCGGAAMAMVLRYWGARDVFPQDFAPLVDASAGGIRTGALVDAVGERGWRPFARNADRADPYTWLRREVDRGRPVIALIAVRPDVYHYVVVIGATPDDVVFHDPARTPFHTMTRDAFERAWAPADRWAMVVLPPTSGAPAAPPPTLASADVRRVAGEDATTCASLVAMNVELARAGRLEDAEQGLLAAAARCPNSAPVWTELAGLRFLQQRYGESADLAGRAVDLAPGETHAWHVLATARYVQGDARGALDAWNRLGQPRTDVVVVEGTDRIDHPVVLKLAGLAPRQLLTPAVFARTGRRLDELPSAVTTSLRYRPQADGTASVHAMVVERPVLQRGAIGWVVTGAHAAIGRELRVLVSSALRQGEAIELGYRFEGNRPRVRLGVQTPAPGPLPGIVGIEAFWERQSYARADEPIREERQRLALHLSDWASGRLRWQVGGAADRIGPTRYLAFQGQMDTRWLDDHLSVRADWGYWAPTSPGQGFAASGLGMAWRNRLSTRESRWTIQAGGLAAGRAAPLALLPIAGSSGARGARLRGHRLLDNGIIVSGEVGRQLAYATVEHQRPVYEIGASVVAVAGFVDIARAWRRWNPTMALSAQADVGVGLRLTAPGIDTQIRLDVGYGLRDGNTMVSAGYIVPWGR